MKRLKERFIALKQNSEVFNIKCYPSESFNYDQKQTKFASLSFTYLMDKISYNHFSHIIGLDDHYMHIENNNSKTEDDLKVDNTLLLNTKLISNLKYKSEQYSSIF